jgi:phosphatidylglycerol lysyltransferase
MPIWQRVLAVVTPLTALGLAGWLIDTFLHEHTYAQLKGAIEAVPLTALVGSSILTVVSFAILSGYDFLGLVYVKRRLPPLKVAGAAAISFAFSNSLGFSILMSGGMRFRLYTRAGLNAGEIAKLTAFCTLTLWLGLAALLPLAVWFPPAGLTSIGLGGALQVIAAAIVLLARNLSCMASRLVG